MTIDKFKQLYETGKLIDDNVSYLVDESRRFETTAHDFIPITFKGSDEKLWDLFVRFARSKRENLIWATMIDGIEHLWIVTEAKQDGYNLDTGLIVHFNDPL